MSQRRSRLLSSFVLGIALHALVMLAWFAASVPAADAAGWSIQPSPNPIGVKSDTLSGVSCSSPSDCMAVGYDAGSISGSSGPLAEHWDGASWSIGSVPEPPGGRGVNLSRVSCTSATFCIAVGDWDEPIGSVAYPRALVERWDGSSWSIQMPPSPPGVLESGLSAVSCASATACTAIGSINDSAGQHLLAEHWDGSGWSSQSIPEPPDIPAGDALSGISCPSQNLCIVVGHYTPDNSGGQRQLVEHWDGSTWSIDSPPDPGGIQSSLSGVSCASATACTAVGSYNVPSNTPAGQQQPLVENWDGNSWSIAPSPALPGFVSGLSLVSCASPTACVALGFAFGNNVEQLLIERWDGTSWSARLTPNAAGVTGTGAQDQDLSCASATACTVVAPGDAGPLTHAVVASWDGTNWSSQTTPYVPDVPNGVLTAVSCSSPASCTSVGSYYEHFPDSELPLVEAGDGMSWSIKPSSFPIASEPAVLSCPSPTACTGIWNAELEHWDGTSWSRQQPASPIPRSSVPGVYADVALAGVSCPSATACTAVGGYRSVLYAGIGGGIQGPDLTLAERWNGRRWSVQGTPIPAGAAGAELSVVSCASRSSCVAIGSYTTWGGRKLMLADSWNGSRWSIRPSPKAPGTGTSLSGLSCGSPTSCIAIGSYRSSARIRRALAESWNGSGWSIRPLSIPSGTTGSQLVRASCASPTACSAIGNYRNQAGQQLALVERWDGRGWSIQPIPGSTGGTGGVLTDISCASATTCTAVGSYKGSAGQQRLTLVERWSGTG
jgi:hypothetical protein